MLEGLGVVLVVLVVINIVQYLNSRNTRKQLQEYKDLFEAADVFQKEAQTRVEELLRTIGGKDLLLDRGATALEVAQERVLCGIEEISSLRAQVSFQEEQYNKLFGQKNPPK